MKKGIITKWILCKFLASQIFILFLKRKNSDSIHLSAFDYTNRSDKEKFKEIKILCLEFV